MRPLAATWVAMACLALAACSREQSQAEAETAARPREALELPTRNDAPTAREALLEQRLRALEAQMAAGAVKTAGTAPPAQAPSRPAPLERSGLPHIDTQQQDQESLALLESAFRLEVTRDAWTVTRASVLRQMLAGDTAGAAVREVECRGRTCRLDLADGDAAVRTLMPQLLQRMPGQFTSVQVGHRPDGTVVLYLQS